MKRPPARRSTATAARAVLLIFGGVAIAATTTTPDPAAALVERREELLAGLPRLAPPDDPDLPAWALASPNPIDRFVARRWRDAGLPEADSPPPLCDDSAFVRRVHLDLIGVVPTLAEREAFLADLRPDRRERLVDALLARAADCADHWTPFWEDALASSPVSVNGGMATSGNWQRWVNDAVRDALPYDIFAASIIDPGMPRAKPPERGDANGLEVIAHFIRSANETETLQSAAAVAQVFMGTAMKCGSCHNHFENEEWPQRRVVAFAGLFAERDQEIVRCERRTGRIIPAAFPFDPGEEAAATAPEGAAARRALAARQLVDPRNPRFAPAIVNRLWKRFLGLGLVEPADDFRDDRPASDPDLLAFLADDLMRHGFDLRRTTRLILTSRVYQHVHDPALEDGFDVDEPDAPRWFRSPALRRLTAEQVFDSLQVAMEQELDPALRLFRSGESTGLTRALGRPAARNDVTTARSEDPSIVAGLELLNGAEFAGLIEWGALFDLALAQPAAAEAAALLFRALLSREPQPEELAIAEAWLAPTWSSGAIRAGRAATHAGVEVPPLDEAIAAGSALLWFDGAPREGARRSAGWETGATIGGEGGREVDRDAARHAGAARDGIADGALAPPAASIHRSTPPADRGGRSQHWFIDPQSEVDLGPFDLVVVEVRVDPERPAQQVLFQLNDGGSRDGGWSHRAYLGADLIPWGRAETSSRRALGPLPAPGAWALLTVPASRIGLGARHRSVVGASFDEAGGRAEWGRVFIVRRAAPAALESLRDLAWAIAASPEFMHRR
ncbi:MAG TPA: DUF1553 domain-containing protein [Phycisphaerales bacterium]|nr:DUF1553 domain-containing protein [Phycisphaerales bacterium]HMP38588.1 DUF1553 domain-containing protein [Phycisphaerales bacterium]